MVLEFVNNVGVLTALFPLSVFIVGMLQQFEPDKLLWRTTFVWTLGIIALKYLVSLNILVLTPKLLKVLLGDNLNSILN